jgi:hypothetical protein
VTQEPAAGQDAPVEPSPVTSGETRLPEGAVEVKLRRAPKYRAFIVTGALVGLAAGVIIALGVNAPTGDKNFAASTLIRYFGAILGLLGAVIGAAVAVLSERRRRR